MSDEQDWGIPDWGADTTTNGPPPSHRREGVSIVSSSQLSPKSPVSERDNRSERNSWGEPGEERIDRRRRSTVTFGGATSVAPSDSISKVKSRSGRGSGARSSPRTQYSQRSRRRSAPWQDIDYRSTYPSKAGSSQGGTFGGAPLTEGALEEFNERQPPRSERDVEEEIEVEPLERKSSRKSRRDSAVESQDTRTRAGWIGADDRRTSRQYSRTERNSTSPPAERTVVTTRRKTEVEEDDGPDEEEIETKSKSRYESYRRPSRSSKSMTSARRQFRAADVYAQAQERRQYSASAAKQTQRARTAFTQRSRPPTMPPESVENAKSSREIEVAAAAAGTTAATSRPDGKSRAQTAYVEECDEEETGQTEAKTARRLSRQSEGRTRQTEVKSERVSEPEVETERKSTSPITKVSGRSKQPSQAPTRPSQAAAAATSPSSPLRSPSSPTLSSSPTAPSPVESHWERRVHIVETRKPDGRLITDREVTMRRFRPREEQVGA